MQLRSAVAAAGVVGAATMGLAAPAMADPPGEVTVSPNSVRQGETGPVTVDVPSACQAHNVTLSSTAFNAPASFTEGATPNPVPIKSTATVGEHRIEGLCDDVDRPIKFHGHVTITPKGGAKTGIGGVSGGTSLPLMGAGVALILGAGGAMVFQRRRATRRTEV
ncbi:hypothetical protein ACQPZP_30270 [Spirillospora sp. CA-142024]|uniref:hypothetical protein n=1 Tax=Spirillospora sp. CA-142024 TaxID=3240036 RepID=UPI003D9444E1